MERVFRFRDFELSEDLLELRRSGVRVELRPKPLFLLLHLLRNRQRVVSRDELNAELWRDVRVSEQSLTTTLYEARRALGDDRSSDPCIATLRGRGYRFCADVVQADVAAPEAASRAGGSAAPGSEDLPADAAAPFVDREREMAQLRAALAASRSGVGRIVLLQGPPGIGKTRTVLELFRLAAEPGSDAYFGRAYPGDGAPPLWPWIEVLRELLETRGLDACRADAGAELEELARLVPALSESPAPAEPGPFTSGHERWTLFDAVAQLLARSARRRPLLIALDDLHDSDESSLELLRFVARRLRDLPLLIVGTHREPARGSTLERVLLQTLREPGVQSLRLEGLQQGSVSEILERKLGAPVAPPLLERVCTSTGGNPFFVAEVARLLEAHSRSPEAGDVVLPIPESLRDTVRSRIAEATGDARELLAAAAVAGPRVHLALLRRVLGLAPIALLEALDACRALDLLRQVGPGEYAFIHGFVRETLYETLSAGERARLHRDVGDALEVWSTANPGPHLAEIAHHFAESASLDRAAPAIRYARLAAQRARELCAPLEAVTQLRGALATFELLAQPDPELRCELQVELCEALFALDAPPLEVEREFDEAARLAQACARWDLFARAVGSNAFYQTSKNLFALLDPGRAELRQVALARLEEALERLGAAHPRLRVALLIVYASLLEREGQSEQRRQISQEMLRLSDELGDPGVRARVIAQRCYLHPDLERLEERLDACRSFQKLARLAHDPSIEVFGNMLEVCLELQRGRRAEAELAAQAILRAEPDPRISPLRPLAYFWRCLTAQLDGRLEDAQAQSLAVLQLGGELNFSQETQDAAVATQQWWLMQLQGQTAVLLEPWLEYVAAHPEIRPVRITLARIHSELGQLDAARRELEKLGPNPLARILRDDNWSFFASVAADVCVDVGDRERALAVLERLTPFAERVATVGWLLSVYGAVARPLGRVCALLGRRDEAEAHFERALDLHRSLASPPLVAWTLIDHARALATYGRRSDAPRIRKLCASAVDAASAAGLPALVARAKLLD